MASRLDPQYIRIRKADLSDVHAIKACIDAAYAKYTDYISDLPRVSDGVREDILNHQVWVAVIDENIVGCLFLVAHENHLKLANLAVHPAQHRNGIARKLTDHAELEALRQGYSEMRLITHRLMPENIRLYEHLGWILMSTNGNSVSMRKKPSL